MPTATTALSSPTRQFPLPIQSSATTKLSNKRGTTAFTISAAITPDCAPIRRYKFFFQPSHIAGHLRYIRTRTIPFPLPNHIRYPQLLTRFASATSSSTSPAMAACPPTALYASRLTIKNCPFAAAASFFGLFTSSNAKLLASLQYTSGIRAFSYHVSVICSGENEIKDAFCSPAICKAFAPEFLSCKTSASVKSSQDSFASLAPSHTA